MLRKREYTEIKRRVISMIARATLPLEIYMMLVQNPTISRPVYVKDCSCHFHGVKAASVSGPL